MGDFESILIIDDDETIRDLTKEFLEGHFETISLASNLDEAIKELNELMFDVILFDLDLGNNENGGSVIEYLKSNVENYNANTPFLVISGFLNPEFIERNKGKVAMLKKPFSSEDLLEKLREFFPKS